MWAVVEISKKQYLVNKGDLVRVEKLDSQESELSFDNVLFFVSDTDILIGTPYVKGICVNAQVQKEEVKGDKVIIYKWRRRKKSRKTQGHRQKYTILKITDIISSKK